MRNRYVQVALTYPRRALGSWYYTLILIAIIVAVIALFLGKHVTTRPSFELIWVWWLDAILIGHVKEQFAHPGSRLTAGFRRPHLAVAGAAAILLTVGLPAAITWIRSEPCGGLVAIFVALLGLTAWAFLSGLWWARAVMGVLLFATFVPHVSAGIQDLRAGQHAWAAGLLVSAGMVGTLLAARRLFNLDEECRVYHEVLQLDAQRRPRASAGGGTPPFSQRISYYFADRHMEHLIPIARRAATSRRARLRRWQVGLVGARGAAFVGLTALAGLQLANHFAPPQRALVPSMLVLALAPVVISVIVWLGFINRRGTLDYESLLPTSRPDFYRQNGGAVAASQAEVFAAVVVAVALSAVMESRNKAAWEFLLSRMAMAGLWQVWIYGLIVWLGRWRSSLLTITCLLAILNVTFVPFIFLSVPEIGEMAAVRPRTLLAASATLALMGAAVTLDGYRRWLKTELG